MKSLYLTLIIMCSISHLQAQSGDDRNVYWAHGLAGDETTWNAIRTLFNNERKMNGVSTDYPSFSGLAVARNNVINDLSVEFPGGEVVEDRNIGIGHSMGGVVLRDIDRLYTVESRRFGGLITVGSPNLGAAIVNSIQSGAVEDAYDDACARLAAGPISMLPIITLSIQSVTNDILCTVLYQEVIYGILGEQLHPSALDLAVDSDVINELGNGNVPIINIWGDENQDVHWRLASSYISGNNNDTEFVNIANSFRQTYNTFYTAHLSVAIASGILGFFNPAIWKTTAINSYRAVQWRRGVNWFDQSETIWNNLIQCKDGTISTPITVEEYYHPSDCYDLLGPQGELTLDWALCLQNCSGDDLCVDEYIVYALQHVSKASDGFICNTSQIMPGVPSGNIYRAQGVNHSEEVVHEEIILKLREIWQDRPSMDFFLTSEQ